MVENRKRNIQKKFYVDEQELEDIYKKMSEVGAKDFSMYIRRMAIDGFIVQIDSQVENLLRKDINKISRNINQILKRIQRTENVRPDDMQKIESLVSESYELLKNTLTTDSL